MKKTLMTACLSALSSLVLANSGSILFEDSTMKIREVVVNSKSIRTTTPNQHLTSSQLEKISNNSIADALKFFSGIQIKDYGGVGGMKTVNIRSLGCQHLGISYDGILLGNAQNGQIDIGQFSLDNVEEVALYNGQKSSIFMSASDFGNAGTVIIRTRRPVFSENKSFNLRFKTKAASYDTYRLSALYEQRWSKSLSSSLSAEAIKSTGKYKFRYHNSSYDTTAIRKNGDIKSIRVEANLFYKSDKGTEGGMKIYTYHSERGIPGAIASNVWSRGERQWDNNTFLQAYIQKRFGTKFSTRLMSKYAYYNTHYVNNDTTRMLIDNRYKQQEFYISSSNIYELASNWNVSVCYDFKWNKLNADTYGFVYPVRYSNLISFASSLQLDNFKIQGSLLATFINDKTKTGKSSDAVSALSPAIFVNWQPKQNGPLSLRTFIKKSFRTPTFNDLYYVDVGNAKLNPETAIQYNIGVAFDKHWDSNLFSSLRIQADAYYNDVKDKIISYPKGTQFRWTMMNLGKVSIHGIDLSAETELSLAKELTLNARLQYTWQKAIDKTDSESSYYKDQLPYTPEHSGSAIIVLSYRNTEFCYSTIYSGERYFQQENLPRNEMEAWQTSDISLSHTFKINRNILRIKAEVNNVFNKDYDVVKNFPMPLRNYSIGIIYEL